MNIEKSLSDKMFYSMSIKDTKNVISFYQEFTDYHAKYGDLEDFTLLEFVNRKYTEYMTSEDVKMVLRSVEEKWNIIK